MGYFSTFIQGPQLNDVLSGKTIVNMEVTQYLDTQLRIQFSNFNGIDIVKRKIVRAYRDSIGRNVIFIEPDIYVCFVCPYVLYHKPHEKLPDEYGIRIDLDDGTCLTIHIPGINGYITFLHEEQYCLSNKQFVLLDVLDEKEFTLENLKEYLLKNKKLPVCNAFKNIASIGYLPDVLYITGVNPKTQLGKLDNDDFKKLYESILQINNEMYSLHGDVDTFDIYGERGRYIRKMGGHLKPRECPRCKTAIEKKNNKTGAAIYFCPNCQPFKGN